MGKPFGVSISSENVIAISLLDIEIFIAEMTLADTYEFGRMDKPTTFTTLLLRQTEYTNRYVELSWKHSRKLKTISVNTCFTKNRKQEKCVEDWPEDSPELDPDFKPVRKSFVPFSINMLLYCLKLSPMFSMRNEGSVTAFSLFFTSLEN